MEMHWCLPHDDGKLKEHGRLIMISISTLLIWYTSRCSSFFIIEFLALFTLAVFCARRSSQVSYRKHHYPKRARSALFLDGEDDIREHE